MVAYRTSEDLLHWSEPDFAFVDVKRGTNGGPTESPFVVERDGLYFLFLGPRGGYVGTDVFASSDPFAFSVDGLVGHVAAHAAEVVVDTDGAWYVSHAGWSQGGVYLAPLAWERGDCVSARTAFYELAIRTRPTAALARLAVSPRGDGEFRDVLNLDYRGTRPYMGVGGWATDLASAAAEVEIDTDAGAVVLRGIPVGDEPVTVDWSLSFGATSFDVELTWHVSGATSAAVWEVGWSLDTSFAVVGDDEVASRARGDVSGFSRWLRAADDAVVLVVAYAGGSAWTTANRWFHGAVGMFTWQTLWGEGGRVWAPGTYAGGRWRIGAAAGGDEAGYARALWEGLNAAP